MVAEAVQQQNSAFVKQALALAMMREKSVVVRSTILELAMYHLGAATDELIDELLKSVEKYRIGACGDVYIIVPEQELDLLRRIDAEFLNTLCTTLLFSDEVDGNKWWNVVARAIENYIMLKISDMDWSPAKELLNRAIEAGFKIEIVHDEDTTEYRITAPTGDAVSVYHVKDPLDCRDVFLLRQLARYRFEHCQST
jgi:hypothetical protein